MRVKLGQEYTTLSGRTVRVLCIDRKCDFNGPFQKSPVVALYTEDYGVESVDYWRLDGSHATNPDFDLLDAREVLKKTLKLDDPIEVQMENGRWEVRHFAGMTLNGILAWACGMTSKTVPNCLYRNTATRGAVEHLMFRAYKVRN